VRNLVQLLKINYPFGTATSDQVDRYPGRAMDDHGELIGWHPSESERANRAGYWLPATSTCTSHAHRGAANPVPQIPAQGSSPQG